MAGYNSLFTAWLVRITLKEVSALFMAVYNYTKRSVSLSKRSGTLFMAGYNYTKRSVHSLHGWLQLLVTITLKEVSALYTKRLQLQKKCLLSAWLVTITLKEVYTLFMTGFNYTKRSVHSLHGWLQLH